MANGTYIGTVVVNEIGYKYILVPIVVEDTDKEVANEEAGKEVVAEEKVFLTHKDLLAELPAPLNTIPYINPAIFPCKIVIEEDEEHGKDEVTTEDQHNDQSGDSSNEISDS